MAVNFLEAKEKKIDEEIFCSINSINYVHGIGRGSGSSKSYVH